MAAKLQMGGVETDRIFIGTDFTRDFDVRDIDAAADGSVSKNIAGWAITFDIRVGRTSPTPPLYSATLSIVGTFNADPDVNTQRARWTCADTDLTTDLFGVGGGTFQYSVKRTDDTGETILQWGPIVIDRATQT